METAQVADGLIHAVGMNGEAVIVSCELALKPLAVTNICANAVLAGAMVVVEVTLPAPRASITFGVTVNVAVAAFPRLSVTTTVCAPATPAWVVVVPAGIVNTNVDVPCSVTVAVGETVAVLVEATIFPT